jgi:hypothetical protein
MSGLVVGTVVFIVVGIIAYILISNHVRKEI